MKKYGYIPGFTVKLDDPINIQPIYSQKSIHYCDCAIRIEIPDDMVLKPIYLPDTPSFYSMTDDTRLIKDLHPTCRIVINGKWVDMTPQLKKTMEPERWDWYQYLLDQGYFWNILTHWGFIRKSKLEDIINRTYHV